MTGFLNTFRNEFRRIIIAGTMLSLSELVPLWMLYSVNPALPEFLDMPSAAPAVIWSFVWVGLATLVLFVILPSLLAAIELLSAAALLTAILLSAFLYATAPPDAAARIMAMGQDASPACFVECLEKMKLLGELSLLFLISLLPFLTRYLPWLRRGKLILSGSFVTSASPERVRRLLCPDPQNLQDFFVPSCFVVPVPADLRADFALRQTRNWQFHKEIWCFRTETPPEASDLTVSQTVVTDERRPPLLRTGALIALSTRHLPTGETGVSWTMTLHGTTALSRAMLWVASYAADMNNMFHAKADGRRDFSVCGRSIFK